MTRDALVEAAAEVFATKGFNGASMEEIAAEAGFTRGAIYSNFGSKDELLIAVLDRFIDRELEQYGGVFDAGDPVAGAVDAGVVFRRSFSVDLIPLDLELRLNALRNPEVRRPLAEAIRRSGEKTARFIEEQATAHGMRLRIPARDLADIGRAATEGLLQFAAVDEEDAARYEALAESVFVMLAEAAVEQAPKKPR